MKAKLLLILMTLSVTINLNAQSYKDLWNNVNKNLEDRLPESAEAFLDKVEQKAIAENNQKELLKSYLYRFKIINQKDENPIKASIQFAEENIGRLQEPEKSIFNVAIASLYGSYLNENFYKINNQQITVNGDELDMEFWDKKTFERVIDKYYENALSDIASLQNTESKSYQDILAIDETKTKFDYTIEPTLYDYVLHKIINHQIRKSLNCIDLYQDLINFDKKNNYNDAAIYNEIHKLKYEYETNDDYESYINSLIKIKNENLDNPLVTSVMALQAEAIFDRQQSTVNSQQNVESKNLDVVLEICDEAIKLFPNSVGALQCETIRSNILRKNLQLKMSSVHLPNHDIIANISYSNLTNPHYRIYRLSQNELDELDDKSAMDVVKTILKKKHIVENEIDIPEKNDYQSHSMNITLPKLECGIYYILVSNDDKFSNKIDNLPAFHSFQVSRLSFVTTKENNDFVVYVLDRESGLPVKDVNVNIFKRSYNYNKNKYVNTTIKDLTTDENGIVKVPNTSQNAFHINLFKDNDMLLSDSHFYNYKNENSGRLIQETIFFTDRAIYRPGQTVYYKGVIVNKNSEINELVVNAETVIYIKDSNGEEISTQTFTTNEFGSFDGSFVIPDNLSNGFFKISNVTGSIYVKVEEYKRPTFEITFNAPDKSYKLNEEVELNGSVKAYAGFGLDNVNYNYTIVRRAYFPYRLWWLANYDNNKKQIAFGEGTTDANGNFNINFELLPDKNLKDRLPVYEYLITVNATNAQGESQTKTYTIKASDIDLIIDVNKDYKNVSIDSLKHISFNVKNLKENPVEAKIIRKIYEVKDDSQQTTDNRHLIYEDIVNVKGESKLFPNVKKLIDKGRYVVELISADNEKAMTSIELTVIDFKSNKMPYNTMCISYYDKASAQPNDNVNFYLGSSAKDVNVYVMIKHGDEVRYYERKTISDKVIKINYKVKEEDRGNISFQAFFVKDNTINIVEHYITVPYDNLDLDIKLDVVRDDLLPGSEETWNLTIKDYKDKGVVANLLAGMYDASLDVFAENHWHFNTKPSIKTSTSPRSDGGFDDFYCFTFNQYPKTYELFVYYLLSDIDLIPIARYTFSARDVMLMPSRVRNAIAAKVGGVNTNEDEEAVELFRVADEDVTDNSQQEEMQSTENQEMSIRENFNETAFFYPNLITNEDGSLRFSFTMPDALTRWNLMMLAYTKDLKVGTLNKTFTTSKPLMIMSDMPRFVYENDTLWMVANVIKTTDNSQQSTDDWQKTKDKRQKSFAKLEIFDALTMEPLDLILSEQEIAIDEIATGNSKSVRWKVAVNNNTNMLAMRFSVSSEDFSDAEQHLLPVLSNEVFMTETYPLIVKENSEKTLDFDFQNENERNYGLTLNICANPVWYAIQSLPYLSQETGQYAEAAFNIFYANSLASYIANNIPNLLDYIKKWELETPDALMSALQKDENLKAIMLQETPWVMEAKSEAEQKAMIANLFDLNTLRNKTDETLRLIKEKQSVNGGWSWFPNMPESTFITQYILGGFGRLYKMDVINSLTPSQQEYSDIITKNAIEYLCKGIIKDYDLYKDYKNISYLNINELYALSFFNFNEDLKYKNAKDFFIKQLKENWQGFNFGTQAKIALILYRNGDKNIAQLIMKSLKERAKKDETLGMYWSSKVSEHVVIMEAFKEINPDEKLLNDMKVWLLNNKRTNMWENAQSTVDAIYALVFDKTTRPQDYKTTSVEVMIHSNDELVIDIKNDNNSSDFMNQYFWNSEEMKDFKDFKVNNESDNLIWGGLFRQYFVSLDEVRKHESPLNVERNIYVERINEDGTYLVPIENEDIKVGDKIVVNLNIESSQDMEFVFLKDMRAACLEPVEQMSRYRYQDGMLYYQSNSDTFMGFYFDRLPKGKHQVSYSMFVTKEGDFSNGYALIQCMYAPEFSSYSEGMRIKVK